MDKSDREQHDQFLRLFMEHEEALRLFVRSLLFNYEESREVMQEVAIVLWRKFDDSQDSIAFRRWAFGVARMEALSFRRDRARDRHLFGDDIAQLLEQTVQAETVTLELQRNALEKCVNKLPVDQRKLVGTAYEPGVTKSDLACKLGWTSMALYKKLHQIRLRLMECTRRELASEGIS
ncbi:RNA polymerase sigma-70 ECF-like, Rhodopirellula baltica [Rhodopirellula maiorica SM1]|uniref:RNA polymerase sigma-70 ECF-like, Rhodopirellula baltica n=1 Tax=Rhodopirellula maiorica SM1 TaxID=1265738 RepID=M5S7V4_9BACT|nr:sigma-70 family RNA polymerase sigma factor [Rhodopirellula maiorica]EMI22249.1 RNA polymerase sigma-70 ECF-like, Rhodopirellula baltica [Rhodopirellula maiorica SM1]